MKQHPELEKTFLIVHWCTRHLSPQAYMVISRIWKGKQRENKRNHENALCHSTKRHTMSSETPNNRGYSQEWKSNKRKSSSCTSQSNHVLQRRPFRRGTDNTRKCRTQCKEFLLLAHTAIHDRNKNKKKNKRHAGKGISVTSRRPCYKEL